MNRNIVYNVEPEEYSAEAIHRWEENGYDYHEGSWEDIHVFKANVYVKVLITRLGGFLSESIVYNFPYLECIISATTGINHIDNNLFENKSLKIITLRGHEDFLKTIPSTAELTFGLILNILRNIHLANLDVIKGNWDRNNFKGNQLKAKVIGIVGLGRIGQKVASFAKAFEMEVIYYDPEVINPAFNKVDSVDDLLRASDIVSIHIHADKENRNFIDRSKLKLMKKTSVLINTSRGEVINETDLVQYLKEEGIAGYAADVISNEHFDFSKGDLWNFRHDPRIFLTPHLGGATKEAMWACELFVQDIFLNQGYV